MEVIPARLLAPAPTQLDQDDFISTYINYHSGGETPAVYHRWCCISMLGALLGRQAWVEHGDSPVYLNNYMMLIGSPGARKSTAVKAAKKLIKAIGYETISAEKSTKEKFLLDLAGEDTASVDDILDRNIFGAGGSDECREMYIAADEFNDFIGLGNYEFISLLGSLWDFNGNYTNRIKTGKSVDIPNPTISILGGNTTTGFAMAFPPEILGQGFFSRLLLIYGEPNGKRIAFPKSGSPEDYKRLCEYLARIRETVRGPIQRTHEATSLLEKIYRASTPIADTRFLYYSNRRFTHLLKLCGLTAASRCSNEITYTDVLRANTYLTYAEGFMPKALGEFGASKHSDISHKVIQILESQMKVMDARDLWKHLNNDANEMKDIGEILVNLAMAEKIQQVGTPKFGYLPLKKKVVVPIEGTVDFGFLTEEELAMQGT